jgi:hypothetical protein
MAQPLMCTTKQSGFPTRVMKIFRQGFEQRREAAGPSHAAQVNDVVDGI